MISSLKIFSESDLEKKNNHVTAGQNCLILKYWSLTRSLRVAQNLKWSCNTRQLAKCSQMKYLSVIFFDHWSHDYILIFKNQNRSITKNQKHIAICSPRLSKSKFSTWKLVKPRRIIKHTTAFFCFSGVKNWVKNVNKKTTTKLIGKKTLFRKQLTQYENLVAMWPFGLYYQPINSGGSTTTSKCQWSDTFWYYFCD